MISIYGVSGLRMPMPSEDDEQRRLFDWAALASGRRPELRMLFAIPNGGLRTKTTAARMKRTGTRKGVPDMMLACPASGYAGLFIELKKQVGGRVSAEQDAWLQALADRGYMAAVCHGWQEAMGVIKDYLGGDWE